MIENYISKKTDKSDFFKLINLKKSNRLPHYNDNDNDNDDDDNDDDDNDDADDDDDDDDYDDIYDGSRTP